MKNKKGVFFSTDALIALIIIFFSIMVIYPVVKYSNYETGIEEDILSVISNLQIGEIDQTLLPANIKGNITDPNKTILEQIGEFYANNETLLAKNLAEIIFSTLNTSDNIGIWYGNTLLASSNSTPFETAKNIEVERQIISGIKEGAGATGFSARAFLSSNTQKKYYYFGGYVGDGNITTTLDYSGELTGIDIEIVTNRDFKIYINNIFSGQYENSSSVFTPTEYDLSAYIDNFNEGENTIKFAGVDGNLYIAGGYLKITYENPDLYEMPTKYYFPEIEGIVNIYDGFYIPGNLNSMEVSLHYDSNYTMFLNIGNTTIFNDSNNGEITEVINNAQLDAMLNYNSLSNKTIPLRLGLEEISGATGGGASVDIVFIIDSTGSMGAEINDVKNIIESFTEVLDNSSIDYQLGLIEFQDYPVSPCGGSSDFPSKIYLFDGKQFTTNTTNFRNTVNSISLGWGNDGPESHLTALNDSLAMDWRAGVKKFNILLTDAPPHAKDCTISVNSCCSTWCTWWSGCSNTNTDETCNTGPKYAINVTNDLIEEDISVFYITKETYICGNRIMIDNLTNLTGGGYYSYTETQGVEDIIIEIAGAITNITYAEQTAEITGNIYTKLYGDSYIEFNFTAPETSAGLITTNEKLFDTSSTGSFSIPENSEIIEAKVLSYSGPRWTENVLINENIMYNLSSYGSNYITLGDPYIIYINKDLVNPSINNIIGLTTGLAPGNSSEGSQSNKIIYKLKQNASAYTGIAAKAEGCNWHIEFEDNSIENFQVPKYYTGTDNCYYNSTVQSCGGRDCEDESDPNADAIQIAVYNLFEILDINDNQKVDVKFTEQDFDVGSFDVTGIPYDWSTEVQIRRWD